MNAQQAHNVAIVLHEDPFNYRHFGPYWWHVKAELRRNGFDKAQLPCLGPTTGVEDAVRLYENLSPEELDKRAFSAYQDNAQGGQQIAWHPNPTGGGVNDGSDGGTYWLHDPDVE